VRLHGGRLEIVLEHGVGERLVGEVPAGLDGSPVGLPDYRAVTVAMPPAGHPVVHPGELLMAIVDPGLYHLACGRIDRPPVERHRSAPGEDGHVVGPLVADEVHHHAVAVVIGIERVEDPAGVDFDPLNPAGAAVVAAEQADTGLVCRVPGVRHLPSGRHQVQAEGDRQVEQDHVLLGEREIVHHRPVSDRDVGRPAHPPAAVDDDVLDMVPGPVVGDGVQLTGSVIGLGVGGEAAGQGAAEIARAERLQLTGKLVRERPGLYGGQGSPGMADDVRVGREVHALMDRASGPCLAHRFGQPLGADPAVPVPLGPAVAQPDAVHHAGAEEPVVSGVIQAEGIGAVAQVASVELDRQPSRHRQVEGGDLLGHGREGAVEEAAASVHAGIPLLQEATASVWGRRPGMASVK